MNRIVNSKKGVAPLTLVAFLVIMVGAVIFTAYLWQTAIFRVGNAIQIQGVLFKPSELRIYVHNIGEGSATVINVYIDEEKFDVDSENCLVNQSNTNVIPKGMTADVRIARSYTQKIHIQVVCSDGTGIKGDYKPPIQ
jgi:hypothetical protein